jgi:hypothetical protein
MLQSPIVQFSLRAGIGSAFLESTKKKRAIHKPYAAFDTARAVNIVTVLL